jgi:epoxyqueuosine reductase QueG
VAGTNKHPVTAAAAGGDRPLAGADAPPAGSEPAPGGSESPARAAPPAASDRARRRADEIKAVGRSAGARVVGIAAASAFDDKVPDGFRPDQILPGARSVVVAGGDGPSAGAWRCPDHRVMEITGYDLRENVAVHVMADHIEREWQQYAIQAPALAVHGHAPPMSMMLAAELAGLGTRSFAAHIILNPEYGLLYYAALITTADLAADAPLDTPACPHPGCAAMYKRLGTTPCLRVCPACLAGRVGADGRIAHSTYNRERCHSRAQTYGIGSFQKALLQIVNEDDRERRRAMIYGDFFTKSIQAVGFYRDSIAQCFECMRVCPVGRKYRKLE